MPLQATSGAASYDAFGGGVPFEPIYIEQVFQNWLYTGNSPSTQTINNGIDLLNKGGLFWGKARDFAGIHYLVDTVRGDDNYLRTNGTNAQVAFGAGNTFAANGFNLSANNNLNSLGTTYASWTFREQPKFFDVVTFTVNSSGGATFNHALGSTPGCVITKRTDGTSNWVVFHRSLGNNVLLLNTTDAQIGQSAGFYTPTSTSVTFANGTFADANSQQVAYLFAHNAGGFGLTGTDNVISCGSLVANTTVDLGYEPQWVMLKNASATGGWYIFDNMRGMPTPADAATLFANLSAAEGQQALIAPTSTGFTVSSLPAGNTFIYIAIRRGPMKPPTTGTSVFEPATRTGTGTATTITSAGFPVDLVLGNSRNAVSYGAVGAFGDRLRGKQNLLYSEYTSAEDTANVSITGFDVQNGISVGNTDAYSFNYSGGSYVNWFFRRAPGFFDVVCWSGNDVAPRNITHNLTVAPEMMIAKNRTSAGTSWVVYHKNLTSALYILQLETTAAEQTASNVWRSTAPTASVFTVGNDSWINQSGSNYVNYLFATCPGVSKVGSYTGNGSSQTINMGFTSGARFFLVKRANSTGDWWVYDSARGIVSAADPALRLNSTAAEVTSADAVDTDSTGLIVNQESTCNINVNGATYIYLGIS